VDSGRSWPPPGDPVVVAGPGDDPEVVAAVVTRQAELGGAVVAAAPVTDTVKIVEGGLVVGHVDRELLVRPTTPVVLTQGVARRVAAPSAAGFCAWVESLGGLATVSWWAGPEESGDPPQR
jgi:2-C-methyl-D-erythritol 4-phosphate cytidylyltransferase